MELHYVHSLHGVHYGMCMKHSNKGSMGGVCGVLNSAACPVMAEPNLDCSTCLGPFVESTDVGHGVPFSSQLLWRLSGPDIRVFRFHGTLSVYVGRLEQ